MWEFSSCHDQNVWNVPSTSKYSRQFSEDFWTLLKMYEDVLTTFELFWIYLKDDHFCALWSFLCGKVNTKHFLEHFQRNWIVLKKIHSNWWVWHEKLSLMREIVVFSPLAWDSHIMGKNTLYTSHNQYQCMLNRSHSTIGRAAIAFIFITIMMSPGQYSLCPFWQKVTTVTPVFIYFQRTWMKMLMQIYTRQSSFAGEEGGARMANQFPA